MTQKEWILNRMKRHGKVTTREANNVGITRLSARIYELRWGDRLKISATKKRVRSRWGDKVALICEYKLMR